MAIQDSPEMDMEKRLLLAMVLSMLVLFLFLYRQPVPPPSGEPAPEVEEPAQTDTPRELPAGLAEAAEVEPTRAARQMIEVENEDLVLRWSNVGGVLQSAQLKGYRVADGNPVEMIPQHLPESLSQVFAIRVGDESLNQRLMAAVYEVSGISGNSVRAPAEITFHYQDAVIEVSRMIRIPEAGYLLEMETEVRSRGRLLPFSLLLGPGIGEITSANQGDFEEPKVVYYRGGSAQRYAAADLEEAVRFDGEARWVALDSKFFTYLLLDPGGIRGARIAKREFFEEAPGGEQASGPLLLAEVNLGAAAHHFVFIGPKGYQVLQETDATLTQLIDYGWFAFLVKPLLLALNFFYQHLHNYGWAIIALTFVINLVLSPVRYKQMVSMKKMSELQPQMKSIQDRYKRMKRTDPRRENMNKEVMALYKAHGVNPLGGCLPLLIQMPFLFAFFTMLRSSIELRGASFIGWWIADLSQPDPYYVTPILMGVSMVVQQKMTPAAGDPTQRKMMMMLPVVFTFFFLNFSSGLVLYFLFSNLFGMMFQFLFQRWQDLAREVPAKKPTKKK